MVAWPWPVEPMPSPTTTLPPPGKNNAAPSVGNSRPWRIVRVAGAEARAAVIRSFCKANAEAAEIYAGEERQAYVALKLAGLREAPVHLAFFTEPEPGEGRGLGRSY